MARLNMKHGFIRYITKNQIDRDNYDKEIKRKMECETNETKPVHRKNGKRPSMVLYRPPSNLMSERTLSRDSFSNDTQSQAGNCETEYDKVDVLFTDQKGEMHKFRVHMNDDPEEIARNFCKRMNYPDELVIPLKDKIVEQCSPYFSFDS